MQNTSAFFVIDAHTGALSLRRDLTGLFGQYKLTLFIRDMGVPSLSNMLTIDIQILDYNDNRPVIQRPLLGATYTVFEVGSYLHSILQTQFLLPPE
jgi:hypothetical protein